ncbi:L-fucose/L-arabinose isomerase family protein [Candidatus Roseilinea sp. NK_OTU-006]|jgi:L-fucose isomerase-like protein|uniref:L-fucose/L-arabinose isomerase family protein n=1 Tax=Candidatus Roseilinea sp. NK_OTU-006 TaxID=2704250 RepID=UPI00145E1061|nr:L-fucose/L-arabinose isomerase family protein [Candidatus Roseilinea sp. NK_OTU-006]
MIAAHCATDKLRAGFVAYARTTFDLARAEEVMRAARTALERAGFELIGNAHLATDLDTLDAMTRALADNPLDVLIGFQATFTDSTFAVRLTERCDAPLLMWAMPEARTGGRLRLNSLCGINLAAHALRLRGVNYHWVYAPPDDAQAIAQITAVAKAGRARRLLHATRLGVVGEHPPGFESCRLDVERLRRRLGVEVAHFELTEVFARARAVNGQVGALREQLGARIAGLDALPREPVDGTLAVYVALRQLAEAAGCDALAVRCWPEFFTELGCAACGAMALLNTDCLPCGCEADANGALTQLILQWISGEPAFGTDLVECHTQENSAVVWHCGQAPLTMADPSGAVRGGLHANRRLPLVMEFALKPGRVTIARLSQSGGDLRLVIGGGEMLAAPPSFSGTSGVLRFDRPVGDVLATIMAEGLEHHIALAYGDHTAALRALARMLDMPTLSL